MASKLDLKFLMTDGTPEINAVSRAAMAPEPARLSKLLAAGEPPGWRKQSWRPLHVAIAKARVKSVRLLLDHGADPNARDEWGMAALHLALDWPERLPPAVVRARLAIIDALFASGADAHRTEKGGRSPLWFAMSFGRGEQARKVVARLLADKPDLLNYDKSDRFSILHMAASWNFRLSSRFSGWILASDARGRGECLSSRA